MAQLSRFGCPKCNAVCKAFHTRHPKEGNRNRMYRRYTCTECDYSFSTIEEERTMVVSARSRELALRILLHRKIDEVMNWQGGPWDSDAKERQGLGEPE